MPDPQVTATIRLDPSALPADAARLRGFFEDMRREAASKPATIPVSVDAAQIRSELDKINQDIAAIEVEKARISASFDPTEAEKGIALLDTHLDALSDRKVELQFKLAGADVRTALDEIQDQAKPVELQASIDTSEVKADLAEVDQQVQSLEDKPPTITPRLDTVELLADLEQVSADIAKLQDFKVGVSGSALKEIEAGIAGLEARKVNIEAKLNLDTSTLDKLEETHPVITPEVVMPDIDADALENLKDVPPIEVPVEVDTTEASKTFDEWIAGVRENAAELDAKLAKLPTPDVNFQPMTAGVERATGEISKLDKMLLKIATTNSPQALAAGFIRAVPAIAAVAAALKVADMVIGSVADNAKIAALQEAGFAEAAAEAQKAAEGQRYALVTSIPILGSLAVGVHELITSDRAELAVLEAQTAERQKQVDKAAELVEIIREGIRESEGVVKGVERAAETRGKSPVEQDLARIEQQREDLRDEFEKRRAASGEKVTDESGKGIRLEDSSFGRAFLDADRKLADQRLQLQKDENEALEREKRDHQERMKAIASKGAQEAEVRSADEKVRVMERDIEANETADVPVSRGQRRRLENAKAEARQLREASREGLKEEMQELAERGVAEAQQAADEKARIAQSTADFEAQARESNLRAAGQDYEADTAAYEKMWDDKIAAATEGEERIAAQRAKDAADAERNAARVKETAEEAADAAEEELDRQREISRINLNARQLSFQGHGQRARAELEGLKQEIAEDLTDASNDAEKQTAIRRRAIEELRGFIESLHDDAMSGFTDAEGFQRGMQEAILADSKKGAGPAQSEAERTIRELGGDVPASSLTREPDESRAAFKERQGRDRGESSMDRQGEAIRENARRLGINKDLVNETAEKLREFSAPSADMMQTGTPAVSQQPGAELKILNEIKGELKTLNKNFAGSEVIGTVKR